MADLRKAEIGPSVKRATRGGIYILTVSRIDGISEKMLSLAPPPIDVVSPKVYGLILASESLRSRLLPEGPIGSPYEILDYRATLVLDGPDGHRATFHRTQQVCFLQNGVSAILDHFWGDGVQLVDYRNTAGPIGDSFKDQGRRHLVIDLEHAMGRGEVLTFNVERTALVGFTADEEWLEMTIDHPIRRLTRTIVFPHDRPCRSASLVVGEQVSPLEVKRTRDGRSLLQVRISNPKSDTPYTIHWSW
jgi:hypothetical protein